MVVEPDEQFKKPLLVREGLTGLLEDAGHLVLARRRRSYSPSSPSANLSSRSVDVRMPPTYEDESMIAAAEIRRFHSAA